MKKQFRTAMLSTTCMLIVAVMSLTGVTYAWFTQGTEATVDGMNVQVTAAAGGIEVMEVKENADTPWGSTLDLDVDVSNLEPRSSANGVDFFNASITDEDSSKIFTTEVEDTSTDASIITKTIKIRNTGTQEDVTINLTDSAITAITEGEGIEVNDIYKAARVALIVSDANGATAGGATTYFIGHNSDTATDSANALIAATDSTTPITAGTAVTNYTQVLTTDKHTDCEIVLPKAVKAAEGNDLDYTEITITIVIWLEGQDVDCDNSNAGGAFDVVLNFKDKTAS